VLLRRYVRAVALRQTLGCKLMSLHCHSFLSSSASGLEFNRKELRANNKELFLGTCLDMWRYMLERRQGGPPVRGEPPLRPPGCDTKVYEVRWQVSRPCECYDFGCWMIGNASGLMAACSCVAGPAGGGVRVAGRGQGG
jgi:hypothetical protein